MFPLCAYLGARARARAIHYLPAAEVEKHFASKQLRIVKLYKQQKDTRLNQPPCYVTQRHLIVL